MAVNTILSNIIGFGASEYYFTITGLILTEYVQAIFHRFLNLIIRGSEVVLGPGSKVGKVDPTRSARSVGLLVPGTDLGPLVGPE